MTRKKLLSNAVWVLLLLFLGWYFLWPVSPGSRLCEEEDLSVTVQQQDHAGVTLQTEYVLPAGSPACRQVFALLEDSPCYRIIDAGGNAAAKGFHLDRQYLLQNEGEDAYLYLSNSSRVVSGGTALRMGLFQSNAVSAFADSLDGILLSSGITAVKTQILSPAQP